MKQQLHTSQRFKFWHMLPTDANKVVQEHDELEEVATGQQPQKEKEKAGLLSKALRAPLGTRTLSLHNLLDQAPFIEGQQQVGTPLTCWPLATHPLCIALEVVSAM